MERLTLLLSLLVALALAGCPSATSGGKRTGPDNPRETGPTLADVSAAEAQRQAPEIFAPWVAANVDPKVRLRAIIALGRLEHLEAWPYIKGLLDDADAAVRAEAVFAAGQLDGALDDKSGDVRLDVESSLIGMLLSEQPARVRGALIAALGKVSRGSGVDNLVVLARTPGPDRVDALTALGVNASRSGKKRNTDTALLVSVDESLKAADARQRRAAAYAAFRQELPISDDRLLEASKDSDPQVRIYVARAMGKVASKAASAASLFEDADWRVRVEALRAAMAISKRGDLVELQELKRAGLLAAKRLSQAPKDQGHEAHVVRASCQLAGDPEIPFTPAEAAKVAEEIAAPIMATEGADAARCACAVARAALDADAADVESCSTTWAPDRKRRLRVEVVRRYRLSEREKAKLLGEFLSDESVAVRASAAWALSTDGTVHAARVARAHIMSEQSPIVLAPLLTLFASEDNEELLSDSALLKLVEKQAKATNFEESEALIEAARLVGARGAEASAARLILEDHDEPRVREALGAVAFGRRSHAPRARAKSPKPAAELPLAATLKSSRGEVKIEFMREQAPLAVENFTELARKGFYDGVAFHRVIGDFVAQGGDPTGTGSGGPGYTIPCENNALPYRRGAIGVALAGKDTGGSQFFLTHSEQPHLDGRYTVFARVVSGWEALDAIQPEDRLIAVDFMGALEAR